MHRCCRDFTTTSAYTLYQYYHMCTSRAAAPHRTAQKLTQRKASSIREAAQTASAPSQTPKRTDSERLKSSGSELSALTDADSLSLITASDFKHLQQCYRSEAGAPQSVLDLFTAINLFCDPRTGRMATATDGYGRMIAESGWNAFRRIIKDWDGLKAHLENRSTFLNQAEMAAVNNFLNARPQLSPEALDRIHPTLGLLCSWLFATLRLMNERPDEEYITEGAARMEQAAEGCERLASQTAALQHELALMTEEMRGANHVFALAIRKMREARGVESEPEVEPPVQPLAHVLSYGAREAIRKIPRRLDLLAITRLAGTEHPSNGVCRTMQAVRLLLYDDCRTARWDELKRHLDRPHRFLFELRKFDSNSLEPERLQKLAFFLEDPDCVPIALRSESAAASVLASWVWAVARQQQAKQLSLAADGPAPQSDKPDTLSETARSETPSVHGFHSQPERTDAERELLVAAVGLKLHARLLQCTFEHAARSAGGVEAGEMLERVYRQAISSSVRAGDAVDAGAKRAVHALAQRSRESEPVAIQSLAKALAAHICMVHCLQPRAPVSWSQVEAAEESRARFSVSLDAALQRVDGAARALSRADAKALAGLESPSDAVAACLAATTVVIDAGRPSSAPARPSSADLMEYSIPDLSWSGARRMLSQEFASAVDSTEFTAAAGRPAALELLSLYVRQVDPNGLRAHSPAATATARATWEWVTAGLALIQSIQALTMDFANPPVAASGRKPHRSGAPFLPSLDCSHSVASLPRSSSSQSTQSAGHSSRIGFSSTARRRAVR